MAYRGGDFGFVGAAYQAPDIYQDAQRSINYYVEISQDDKSKTPTALLGCPGQRALIELTAATEVRGLWVLPGGTDAIVVCSEDVYRITTTVPATQTSIAQFSASLIYSGLLTNHGPVSIRDNGLGGYAVIVDGPYGYLVELATNTVTQITDPAFLGADRVAFIDGWWIFNRPGTQSFYTNAPLPYTITFAGAFFALKDSSSDNLITLMENNRELWLIGERTSEVWYNAGGANFSFSRIPGVAPQIGCAAVNSLTRVGTNLMWLARNEQGQNVVVRTNQYSYEIISTTAINSAIASYPLVSDAIGLSYEEDGHLFYLLVFPTADKTWAYDAMTNLWHERASFDSVTGTYHRFRGNCFMNLQNLRLMGDYQSGYINLLSRQVYEDSALDSNGALTTQPLVAVRRAPHLWSRENRKRLFHASLQIDFAPGVGLQTGQGENPQAMLRWSDDGGSTFGNEHWTTIGKAGRYKNRALWRRLGHARDRVYEMSISDPVSRDIVGATLFAQGEVEAA
jgi:hypothetical protein